MISFSVIIPAYNSEAYIERALLSCKNQSLQAKEIIVIDDNSRDNTIDIVKQSPFPVKLIQLNVNKGPAYARNMGWNAATGDYVAFLDSDDEWHPEKLKILSKILGQNPKIDFVFHPYTLADFKNIKEAEPNSKKISFINVLFKNPAQTSCIAIKNKINYRFNPAFRYCEDHELLLRLAYDLNCVKIPSELTRLHRPQLSPGGLSGQKWKMRKGEMKAYLNVGKINFLFIIFIPFLLLFSTLKHLTKVLKYQN